jgi:hypothetical protein
MTSGASPIGFPVHCGRDEEGDPVQVVVHLHLVQSGYVGVADGTVEDVAALVPVPEPRPMRVCLLSGCLPCGLSPIRPPGGLQAASCYQRSLIRPLFLRRKPHRIDDQHPAGCSPQTKRGLW